MNTMATEPSHTSYPGAPSPYSFVVSPRSFVFIEGKPVPVTVPVPAGLPSDAEMRSTVELRSARRDDAPLATVFRPGTPERWSHRTPVQFWIHGGPDGKLLCAVHPAGPGVFDVQGADGAPLARITRHAARFLPWPRRVRWSVASPGTARPLTGKVGTWYSWFLYLLAFPVWLPFLVILAVHSRLENGVTVGGLTGPTRTRWRAPGGTALDYRPLNKFYRYRPQLLDFRITYALATLHRWDRDA